MRTVLVAAYLLAVLVTVVGHTMLPAEVAIHFGVSGAADGWAPRSVSTGLFLGLHTFMFLMFLLTPRLAFRLPDRWINLPNRDYWLAADRRDVAFAILTRLMDEYGAATLVWMGLLVVQTVHANLRTPQHLDNVVFLTSLVAYLGYTAWWCVRLYAAYRRPREDDPIGPT